MWKGWLRGLALTDGEGVSIARNSRGVWFPCRRRHQQWIPQHWGTPEGTCPPCRQHPTFAEERSCMDLVSLFSPLGSLQVRAAKEVRAVPWLLSPGSLRALLHLAPAALCREGSTLPASFLLEEHKTTGSSQQERKL